jgi:hypothetical protein
LLFFLRDLLPLNLWLPHAHHLVGDAVRLLFAPVIGLTDSEFWLEAKATLTPRTAAAAGAAGFAENSRLLN